MNRRVVLPLIVFAVACCTSPVDGHGIFKKTLEKKYDKKLLVTCNMCHVKAKPKTERGEIGKLLHKELKDQDLSARWEAVKGEERLELEKQVMAPEFLKALEKVLKKENPEGVKYSELIPNGKIEGSKLRN